MSILQNETYRRLALDSSNLMMEWDGHRLHGRYEEGAQTMVEAAVQRLKMGQMCLEAGMLSLAAEDWLSSAACFVDATSPTGAQTALAGVQAVEASGNIPADWPNLSACIREREADLDRLRKRIEEFFTALRQRDFKSAAASEELLTFLLQQRRELPGLAALHYAIFRTASTLGRQDLALTHAMWATVFDPRDDRYAALYGYQLVAAGQLEEAMSLAHDELKRHPSSGAVRHLLAYVLTLGAKNRPADYQQVLDVLHPLLDPSHADVRERAAALTVSQELHRLLGRQAEADRLERELDELVASVGDERLRDVLTRMRQSPPASVNGMNHSARIGTPVTQVQQLLLEDVEQLHFSPAA